MSEAVAVAQRIRTEGRLPPALWDDLLAVPWAEDGRDPAAGLDCFGLVVEVYRRLGVELPDPASPAFLSQRGGWEAITEPEPGCAVLMVHQGRPHVGVYLGVGEVLHSTRLSGVVVSPLRAAVGAGLVKGYARTLDADPPVESLPAPADGDLTVVEINLTGGRVVRRIPWQPGLGAKDLESPGLRLVSGTVEAGGIVVLARWPGQITFFAAPAIATEFFIDVGVILAGVALSLAAALLMQAAPPPKQRAEESSPTFDLSGFLRNRSGIGAAQPVVYGTHRVGGHIISAFQRADSEGRSVLYVLIMVSRGPIHSIAGLTSAVDDLTGPAIPAAIEIDSNPASSYNCSVSVRLGLSDQEPIPGFRETVNVSAYTFTLLVGNPFTHVGTQRAEAFEVLIQFPIGLYDISPNGGVSGRTVTFAIRRRVVGTTTWDTDTFVVQNARRGPFARMFRKDGLAKDKYEIQIERLSPAWPETATDKESQSVLTEVHEITTDELSYPGKALLAVRAVATDQLSGGIPSITSTIKGRTVYIWDGISETAPTFTGAWSDNPAWCAMDALINPHYGLGRNGRLSLDNIDLAAFLAWANLVDTMVDDGRGGTTQRSRCDLVLDTVRSGWEVINGIALSSWARLIMIGRKVKPVLETTATPIYAFTMGNVRDVELTYQGRYGRVNAVEVQYFNEETNYEADQASRLDTAAVITAGETVVQESIAAVGVTRAAQAYRLAQWRMLVAKHSKRRLAFTAGVESIHLLPGDVIYFTHDANAVGTSGRVLSATTATVVLDHSLAIPSGTNKITVKTSGTGADMIQERTLTNGTYSRGVAITVTAAWDGIDVPVAGDPYMAGTSTSYRQTYRVLAIETEADLSRRFTCVEYSASIYSDDPGDVEEFTDVMPDPRAMPGAVENLRVEEVSAWGTDGRNIDAVRVTWDPDERWHGADVWYRSLYDSDGATSEWLYAGRSHGDRLVITDGLAASSTLVVSVVPVSKRGTRRTPEYGTLGYVFIRGRHVAPTAPASVSAHVVNGDLTVCIGPPTDDRFVAGYQIRYGSTWAASVLIAECVPEIFSTSAPFTGTQTVRVRSVSSIGVVSVTEVTASVTFQLPTASYTQTDSQDEGAAWSGTKTQTVVSGTTLILDGTNLTGTYANAVTETGTRRGVVTVTAGLQNVLRTWDDCAMRWDDCSQTWDAFYLNGFEVAEGLTWDDMGFTWDSLPASCMTWDGPIDIVAALAPSGSINDGSVAFGWCPFERSLTNVAATITMRRPHSRYVPELSAMNTRLWSQATAGAAATDEYADILQQGGM